MPAQRIITAFGETKSLDAWLLDKRCVVKRTTLHKRLHNGMEAEKAIAQPFGQYGRKKPEKSHINIGPLSAGGAGRHMIHARIVLDVPTRVTNASMPSGSLVLPPMGPAPGTNRFIF